MSLRHNSFSLLRHRKLADVIALFMLVGIAWALVGFLVRDDLFIFGDHPGHYWRLWYSLNIAWQQRGWVIDWIPHWYAGYPEMQFYPPLYVLLGWVLNLIAQGRLSTTFTYECVIFISYALPSVTFYYAVRQLGFARQVALAASVGFLVFPIFWIGADSAFIGMIGSRMALGLNALVLAWGVNLLETGNPRYMLLACACMAVALLAHPFHEIGILLALAIYVLIRRLPLLEAGTRLTGVVLFALALDAFWVTPIIAHSSSNYIPILRATSTRHGRILPIHN